MAMYIYKDGQQSGPHEENLIEDQLKSGLLSPDVMAVRPGDTKWQPLKNFFPGSTTPPPPSPVAVPAESPAVATAAPSVAVPVARPIEVRGTTLEKVFFGLCLLGAAIGIGLCLFLAYSYFGPSGNLNTDLANVSWRRVSFLSAISFFVGGFFVLLAFLLTFKRKIIQSNGLRIVLRLFFIFLMFLTIVLWGVSAFSYITYRPETRSGQSNELLDSLTRGIDAAKPFEMAAMLAPAGLGLFLFGLSGSFMTKKSRIVLP